MVNRKLHQNGREQNNDHHSGDVTKKRKASDNACNLDAQEYQSCKRKKEIIAIDG
jgi:hypothetical protein